MPRGLHLRGRPHAVHPPGRVRRLRRLRAGLPGRGDLLRRRRTGAVEGLLQGQRRVLLRPRLPRRCVQDRQGRHRPPGGRRHAAAGRGGVTLADRLPAFTWDRLAPLRLKATQYQNELVDLSMGTPVDPVPDVVRAALAASSDWPGYPATRGTAALREAAAGWLDRCCSVTVCADDVLPVVGTKEFVAAL